MTGVYEAPTLNQVTLTTTTVGHEISSELMCQDQTYVWGSNSCSSGRLGHQREVGGGARCQPGSRENTFMLVKNAKGKNQGRNSQKGLHVFLLDKSMLNGVYL